VNHRPDLRATHRTSPRGRECVGRTTTIFLISMYIWYYVRPNSRATSSGGSGVKSQLQYKYGCSSFSFSRYSSSPSSSRSLTLRRPSLSQFWPRICCSFQHRDKNEWSLTQPLQRLGSYIPLSASFGGLRNLTLCEFFDFDSYRRAIEPPLREVSTQSRVYRRGHATLKSHL